MSMKISPVWIVTGLLIVYILYLTQCRQKTCPPAPLVKTDTQSIISEYTTHTIPRRDTVYKPGDTIRIIKHVPGKPPEPVFVEVVKEIPAHVDTAAILQDYYSKNTYSDSIAVGKGKAYVTDTVYKNRLQGRSWRVHTENQIITKTAVTPLYPRQLYIGGGGYNSNTEIISGAHIDLGYTNRKRQSIEISILRIKGQWHKGLTFHQTIW